MDPLRGIRTPDSGDARGHASEQDVARPRVPSGADEARRLAQAFELQLMQSTASIGVDASGDGADGEDGADAADGDEFGLDAIAGMDLMSMLMPTLLGSGASASEVARITQLVAGAAGQVGGGAGLLGSDSDASFDGTGTAATGADLLTSLLDDGGQTAAITPSGTPAAGARANARVVADAASRAGVDPVLAVAMMLVESGGNNRAVGDGGTSFGLFQLHEGGMLTAAGLSAREAFDPATNAGVAMRSLAATARKYGDLDPGRLAAASQRPADPVGYAAKVHGAMDRARSLLGGA